jgi:hypothetical protein
MIRVTYQARDYQPAKVRARYVRLSVTGEWQWCEVGEDRRYHIRQGTCAESDVPADLRHRARDLSGQAFAYVAAPHWPGLASA